MIGLGHDFTVSLFNEISADTERPFDRGEYDAALKDIYAKYSTEDLVKFAPKYYKER